MNAVINITLTEGEERKLNYKLVANGELPPAVKAEIERVVPIVTSVGDALFPPCTVDTETGPALDAVLSMNVLEHIMANMLASTEDPLAMLRTFCARTMSRVGNLVEAYPDATAAVAVAEPQGHA